MRSRLFSGFIGIAVGLAAAVALVQQPAPATVVTQSASSLDPAYKSADLNSTQAQLDQVTWFMIGLQSRVTAHNEMTADTLAELRRRIEELERQVGVHSIYRSNLTNLWAEIYRLDRDINGTW